MHNSQNKKTLQIVLIVLVAVLTLGIGYASISAINLIINGGATANPNDTNFKVKFLNEDGVTPMIEGAPTNTVQVDSDTTASFNVSTLNGAGQSVTATYRVKNESSGIGASIGLELTNSNPDYFKVTQKILDNKLHAGEETTVTVKVEMIKTPVNNAVSTSITATLVATPIEDADATGGSSASKVKPGTFAGDSWTEIAENVRNNNTSSYHVGDTKTVTIDGRNYTVRVANKSTDPRCSNEDYSETACGFVVEFAESVYVADGGFDYYPSSEPFSYIENTLFAKLPQDLQNVMATTRVTFGEDYYCSDNDCYHSINQKLYLLSGYEIIGEYSREEGLLTTSTTQLDYYKGDEPIQQEDYYGDIVNTFPKAIKKYNDEIFSWLLRTVDYGWNNQGGLDIITHIGNEYGSTSPGGIAPAFRIG